MKTVISKDGTKIAYEAKGEGPVLMLVLGALNRRGSGNKLRDLLAGRFTVVTYDRRGRGDSTDTLPYGVEKEIQDLDALIGVMGGSSFLYGHSSGAILALLAARKLGGKVAGLALYEIPYDDSPASQKVSEAYKSELARLLAEDKRGEAVALFVKSVGVSDKQVEAMKRLPMWKGLTAMAPTLAYDTIELMRQYPKTDASVITTPALVMYGAASPAFMGGTAKKLSVSMPNAALRPLDGQTHDVKADVLAPVISEFYK